MNTRTLSEKFSDFTDDQPSNRRWVTVKGKTPVRPGTDYPVAWRKVENRYSWESIKKIPSEAVGIILNKTGLTCVDFDKCLTPNGTIADDRIATMVQRLDSWTEISSSGTGLHTWVITDANFPNTKPGTGYEVITDGHVKVTGNSYPPTSGMMIRVVYADDLKKILGLNGTVRPRTTTRCTPEAKIPEGSRNNELFRLAARLRHDGMSAGGIAAALLDANRDRCTPPLPDDEVVTIASHAGAYPPGIVSAPSETYNNQGLLTTEVEKLILENHHNTAIAKFLNTVIGTESGDNDCVRYCTTEKWWFTWDKIRWVKDERNMVLRLAWDFVCALATESIARRNLPVTQQLMKSESNNELNNALKLLAALVSVTTPDFDKDDTLLNCLNGTVNLISGEIREFHKNDMISRLAPVKYDANARCPKWDAHLKLVFKDDEKLIAAYQRLVGYCLIGGNSENRIFINYGSGKNGKSVTVNTIAAVFGDYAQNADASSFYTRDKHDAPRPDIARMKGRRLITIPEGKAGKFLDEGLIKKLSGGDSVTARFLYGRDFDFIPTAKLFWHTNHLPRIRDRDEGIWRRPYPIPFTAVIPENKRIKDYDKVLFSEEGSGILNWALVGLADYRKEKCLLYPAVVTEALEQYRASTDILAEFLEGFVVTHDEKDSILRADLWNSYLLSAGDDHHFPKSRFNAMIEERLGAPAKRCNDGMKWIGIRTRSAKDTQTGLPEGDRRE